ncbi:MAG: RNA polymerase sigma factor [Pirellulales bacterium]|nr:RNA polymerase sigma factor [Pirellulales bacterium]
MMSDGQRPDLTDRPRGAGAARVDVAEVAAEFTTRITAEIDVARLVVEHHADVYRYAYRLSGAVADAEDLTQQTFLLAQSHRAQLRQPELARRWLFSILRHEFLRTRRKQQPIAAGMLADVCDEIAPPEGPIDQEALRQALSELPDDFKVVLLAYYFEERSYREIAEELEVPLGTVMSRLSRAKRQLRGKLLARESQRSASLEAANGAPRAASAMAATGNGSAAFATPDSLPDRTRHRHGTTGQGMTPARKDSVTE